ncbi:MAG: SPFH domain-containing protein [Sedimentisphaerales bacterium]
MTVSSKSARVVALGSLAISIVFFVISFLIGRWSHFFAVYAVSYFFLGAALIEFILLIQFHQRFLAEQEKLDMTELSSDRRADKIFQQKGEQAQMFAVAQKRLQIFEKWFLPVFAVIVAAYQAATGLYLLKAVSQSNPAIGKQALLCAVIMAALCFVSFLVSRYATGMSTRQEWKPLRAGGSFLFGSAIISIVLTVALVFVQYKVFTIIRVVEYCIPVILILLGIETLINVVLDIYRPRLAGLYSRAAFDSRLLGLLNEPGEILHTAAGAMDYQFGFQVSQTWFYKLLQKAVIPLLFFGAATLYLLSCVVVVGPDEQAIIEHFGNPKDAQGNVRLIEPGIHFKLPWPIDVARIYPTSRIVEIPIGYIPKIDPKTGQPIREPLLWGKDHYKEEFSVLVASRKGVENTSQGAAPVSLLKANIPVQYQVKNLYDFLYSHNDYEEPNQLIRPGSEKRLEEICYQELTKFAAGATIEVDDQASLQNSLLGAGRTQAKEVLTRNIQQAADKAKLGVKIVFLGIQGIHPPTQVAADYEKVVGAVQTKQAIILFAQALRNRMLTQLAGSVDDAEKLSALASQYQEANARGDSKISTELDKGFTGAGGEIFARLRTAQSYAFEKVAVAEATGLRFASQVKAYRAAEEFYIHEQRLTALEDGLANIRKYVIVADINDSQVYIVDLQEKLTPSLYEMGGFQEQTKK